MLRYQHRDSPDARGLAIGHWALRITGDVVAGSAFTGCRAGGLRPVRGKPREP